MFVLVGVVRFEWKTVDGSPREMIKFKRILAPIPENFKTESFILLLLSRQFAFCFLLFAAVSPLTVVHYQSSRGRLLNF
jgi:hypothetical protein